MPAETVLNERTTESACPLALELEISEELEQALRSQHERLSRDANPALAWNRFLHGCLAIGLDRLQRIPALEVLDRIDRIDRLES